MTKRLRTIFLLTCILTFALSIVHAFEFKNDFNGTQRPADLEFDTTGRAFWQMNNGWLDTGNGKDLIAGADGYSFGIVNVTASKRWTNYLVQTRFYMTQPSGDIVLIARYKDRRNYYRAVIDITPNSRFLRLERINNGNLTALASQNLDSNEYTAPKIANTTEAESIVFGFLVDNSTLTVKINGETILRKNDNLLAMGSAGIGQSQNRVLFDLIEVASPGESSAIATPDASGENVFSVQIASMRDIASARNLYERLASSGYSPFIVEDDDNNKVMIGRFASRSEASKMRVVMVSEGFTLAEVVDLTNRPEAVASAETSSFNDVPATVLDEAGWENLTPEEQKKIADLVQRKMKTQTESQTVAEIMEIKRQVEALSQEQKKFINLFETEKAERLRIIEETRRMSQDFDRAIEYGDLVRAQDIINNIETKYPSSSLPKILSTRLERIRKEKADEKDRAEVMREVNLLRVQAQELAKTNKLNDMKTARSKWETVRTKAALWDNNIVNEASSEIEKLQTKIDALEEQESRAIEEAIRKGQEQGNLIWFVLAGIVLFIVVLVVVIYLAGRRRYLRMMQQMREEALAPLEDLRQRAQLGSQETTGIEYQEAQGMIEQTDDSSAEYMIPEKTTEVQNAPAENEIETQQAPETSQVSAEAPPVQQTPPITEEVDDGIDIAFDSPAQQTTEQHTEPQPEPQSQPAAVNQASVDDDESISIDFGDDLEIEPTIQDKEPVNIAPNETQEEESLDDLVFDFDDTIAHDMSAQIETPKEEPQSQPLKPEEIQSEKSNDDIFDISESPTIADIPTFENESEPVSIETDPEPQETPKTTQESPAPAKSHEPQLQTSQTPDVIEPKSFADKKTEPTMPQQTETHKTAPEIAVGMFDTPGSSDTPDAAPSAQNVIYSMEMNEGEAGQPPQGWNGEITDYAAVQIVEDPAGNGQKCMRFRKTSGSAPTSFAHWFEPVQGKFNIDFKVRCDDKNKHLLGLYFEADADFRRSIHTVVQYAPGNDKAHLRVFTRPTPYKMGEWVSVHYEVDLEEGLVDGYVDGELVAEGIRMGMSTDKINVLSIRDNAETTGTLYMKDFTISQA